MKYGFGPRPKGLQEKLDDMEKKFRLRYANMCELWELVDVLSGSKLWHSTVGTVEASFTNLESTSGSYKYYWPELIVRTYEYPLEMVIDELCGPIHREFGVDWEYVTEYGNLQLKAFIPNDKAGKVSEGGRIAVIYVNEGEAQTCRLVKKVVRISEPQPIYEYEMDCAEGDV